MPHFRFIIEGAGLQLPSVDEEEGEDCITGFFTTRRARAPNRESAESIILRNMADEWSEHKPDLIVVDGWRTSFLELRRVPNKGHVFFSDDYSRYAAASLEAGVSRAPKDATIWQLASEHVDDDD